MATRIGLLHSVVPAIGAVEAAFGRLWPEAERDSLYDQSLYLDLAPDRSLTPELYRRVKRLLEYMATCGVDAILVTGSLFGPAVEAGRKDVSVPVLTSFDGLIDAAFARGSRFSMLATDPGTNRMLEAELRRRAEAEGKILTLDAHFVPDAMNLVQRGDRAGHDRLVVEAAKKLAPSDAILLGQFSMAPTRPLVEQETGRPVLDAAEAAVQKLRCLLGA